jgi:hypothetical protein
MTDAADAQEPKTRDMTTNRSNQGPELDIATSLRRRLLRLAAEEDALATDEAARIPYWQPCPVSVLGHRRAASALRLEADRVVAPYWMHR